MRKHAGFTLIEISIVLVIIGLLAGGILKGQQMIENSKYKAWLKQIDEIRTAFTQFQERYKYMPGDFPYASRTFPVVTGLTYFDGNGDGRFQGGAFPAEATMVVQHLRAANLISGEVNSTFNMLVTPVGGGFQGVYRYGVSNEMIFLFIPGKFAQRLDEETDDGATTTGKVRCHPLQCTGGVWPNDLNVTMYIVL